MSKSKVSAVTGQGKARSRSDRKEATRSRILRSALRLVEQGRSPSELGLREVAREAGMAAPSIYNHFSDMDALGLALVDDCLARLRSVVRSARKEMADETLAQALDLLLQRFIDSVNEYEAMLRLLIMQWFNANPEYRKTIRREMSIMRQDFADSMSHTGKVKGFEGDGFQVLSDAIFSLLITYILNVIDMDQSKREERLVLLEKQVKLLLFASFRR